MIMSVVIMADGAPISQRDYDLGDDIVVRLGCWYWFRKASADMELRESVLPDLNFGPVEEEELRAVLSGTRRDYGAMIDE